jgi:alkylation response protein AidB-like acyl-CoA dehydrogenase
VLGSLAAGTAVATWAVAEACAGWRPSTSTTSITVDGDELVVQGRKDQVEAAAAADWFLISGSTEGGLTQVVLPAGTLA